MKLVLKAKTCGISRMWRLLQFADYNYNTHVDYWNLTEIKQLSLQSTDNITSHYLFSLNIISQGLTYQDVPSSQRETYPLVNSKAVVHFPLALWNISWEKILTWDKSWNISILVWIWFTISIPQLCPPPLPPPHVHVFIIFRIHFYLCYPILHTGIPSIISHMKWNIGTWGMNAKNVLYASTPLSNSA